MDTNKQRETWPDLVDFIAKETGFSNKTKLSRQTTLNRDIGLDGDDADEFMAAYFKQFEVEYGNYDWSRYFGEEGFNPIGILIDVVRRKPALKPLTLGMLELAVTMGKWHTEILEQASLDLIRHPN